MKRLMQWARGAVFSLLALNATACASDVLVSGAVGVKTTAAGVVYALPMGQVQITASRKAITPESVEAAKKAAEAAKTKLTDSKKLLETAKALLENLKGQQGVVGPAGVETTAKDVAIAQAQVDYLGVVVKADEAASAAAGRRLESLAGAKEGFEETVKVAQLANAPDPSARRVAYLRHDATRTDKVKLVVSNGLLSTATTSSTDELPNIILSLAQFAAAAGNPAGGFVEAPGGDQAPEEGAAVCETYGYAAVFDPMKPQEVVAVGEELTALTAALVLRVGGYECVGGKCAGSPAGVAGSNVAVQGLQYRAPVSMTISILPSTVKRPRPVDPCGIAQKFEAQTATFFVPDPYTNFVVDGQAGAFTTTSFDYSFKDGMLVSSDQSRPSEIAGAAMVPINVLKAVVSVPGEILKLRVDYDSQANARAKASVENVAQQTELLKAIQALEAQRDAMSKAASNDDAPGL